MTKIFSSQSLPSATKLKGFSRLAVHRASSKLLIVFAAFTMTASAQTRTDFTVDFTNCSEFAGEGPISLAAAAPLVPKGFAVAGAESGAANIVIRATNCASVKVNSRNPQPTTISQIGINIVPPDGTGDINNYTLVYVSDNPYLIEAFLAAGLPARFDSQLTYEYTAPPNGNGNLYVAAGAWDLTPYFIYGPEAAPPPNSAEPFLANWWYAPRGDSKMLQQTLLPNISFGTSSVTFYTSADSLLGKLIGGNTFSNFSVLALRGVYPSGHMDVTTSR
ncbi:hypothetical protein HNQ77_003852 [Silvibacterium bohemicum]|uniref:Uncharacterized protein n=1 Tax=Silvibacterium bohemicum TaxID=1577686 RepID=A0A841JWY5_9BACT|nr:hypothetical protein [Silvibacterium bohemicum]MBB6145882.1 hypothetical protein [Silvibacterium bohemicum]